MRRSRVVELRPNGKYRQVDIQKPDVIALPETSDKVRAGITLPLGTDLMHDSCLQLFN